MDSNSHHDTEGGRFRLVPLLAALMAAAVLSPAAAQADVATGERHYEMVTPPDKGYADAGSQTGVIQAAESADRVIYLSAWPFPDAPGSGMGNQYLAERSPDGWSTRSLTPAQDPNVGSGTIGAKYDVFTPELTAGVLQALDPPLTPDAVGGAFTQHRYLKNFSDPAGEYTLLSTLSDPSRALGMSTFFGGASADLEHVFFESTAAMTADTPNDLQPHAYVWTRSGLRFVGYLPDGSPSTTGSLIGRGGGPPGGLYTQEMRSVARDGSSAVVSTGVDNPLTNTGDVYLWQDGDPVLDVARSRVAGASPTDGSGRFEYAASDHRRIFFTSTEKLTDDATATTAEPDLYMYEPATDDLTDLTTTDPAGGGAEGILGASEDGSRVYFVATGSLATGAAAGATNLYLWDVDDGLRYITQLSPLSSGFSADDGNWDWLTAPLRKASRVSLDGSRLMFSSVVSQTGENTAGHAQLYLYDADAGPQGELSCASCRRDGTPSTAAATTRTQPAAAQLITQYLPRTLTPDGSRMFFNTREALVPADVNGRLDVYEYEDGAPRLISTGRGDFDSYFADASASGEDVFFTTRQHLSGWDSDGNLDLYVARYAGSPLPEPPPPPPAECEGSICQGPSRNRPTADRPGSSLLARGGNVEDARPRAVRAVLTPLSRRQRMALARSGRATLTVRTTGAGRVTLTATGRVDGKRRRLARGSARAKRAGSTRVSLRLSSKARATLRSEEELRLVLVVRHTDSGATSRRAVTLHG